MGANRQSAGRAEGSRFRFGLFVWCGLPVGGQSGGADHADLQYRRHEPPSQRDQQSSRCRCSCRGDPRWCRLAPEPRPGGPRQYHLVELPPYSPELNPVERIWHYLRSHWLANSVFRNLADIIDACETAWNRFAAVDRRATLSPRVYTLCVDRNIVVTRREWPNWSAVRGRKVGGEPLWSGRESPLRHRRPRMRVLGLALAGVVALTATISATLSRWQGIMDPSRPVQNRE